MRVYPQIAVCGLSGAKIHFFIELKSFSKEKGQKILLGLLAGV